MILPLWQTIGQSSHVLAQEVGKVFGEKATHTGTLDPMAEGVVVVLTGEDRWGKSSFPEWRKTYHFSILWGISTDSHDRLGLITSASSEVPNFQRVQEILRTFPLQYEQEVPAFSARRWKGGSSFDWAREGTPLEKKTRSVILENFSTLEGKVLSPAEVKALHQASLQAISGNFRQQAVIDSWNDHLAWRESVFFVTEHRVTVSSGTYIRQLVRDIAQELGYPATTWSITREKNGPYTQEDCTQFEELTQLAQLVVSN